jgi:pimeloyl-ACP methyl ester carboxylesterase
MSGWLRRIGYRPVQSGIALNAGSLRRLLGQVERRAEQAVAHGERLTLIGHSLGGVFARVLAVSRPDLVEDAITLGSPLVGNPRDSAHPLVRALGEVLILDNRREEDELMAVLCAPLPAGTRLTSLYSKEDAVVHWRACMDADPRATCMEVRGTHVGLAWNASVYRRVGHILAN